MIAPEKLARWQSALPFWVSFLLLPMIWFAALRGGWALLLVPLVTWYLFAALDGVFGLNLEDADPETSEADLLWYRALTSLWVPLQFLTLFGLIAYASRAGHLSGFEKFFLFFGVGVVTGTVGIKPTYGRCSRWGIVAFASSLDQAGPMTKSVRDAAIMLEAMAGHDPKDSTSADLAVPDFEAMLTGDIRGKKIGIPQEYRMEGMPAEIEKLWADGTEMLKAAGAEIVDISLPHTKYALPAYYVIAPAEASSNLARYDGVRYGNRAALEAGDGITEMYEKTRAAGFGSEVQRRVMVGTYVLSAGFYDAYYNRARRVRALIKKDFDDVFAAGVDAILTPATPSAAFGLGEMTDADPVQMYLNDVFTVTVNLAGLPGISVPTGLDAHGLPLGLQLIGRPWEEGDLLNTAYALESAAGFVAKPGKWW